MKSGNFETWFILFFYWLFGALIFSGAKHFCGLGVPLHGGFPVPFGGYRIVLGDAGAEIVHVAGQHLRLGVAGLGKGFQERKGLGKGARFIGALAHLQIAGVAGMKRRLGRAGQQCGNKV